MQAAKQARAVATREAILRAATGLFTRKGYHDTKLDDILKAADVTTGAFFHHFRSKEEVAFAAMDWYLAERRRELIQIEQGLRKTNDDEPLAAVFRWLDATQERFRQRAERREAGCIFGNLSTTLCETHEGFRQRLAESFDQMALDFKPRLDVAARACGKRIDTMALARYLIAVLEGSIVLARAHQEPRLLAKHFQFVKEHLRQTFGIA